MSNWLDKFDDGGVVPSVPIVEDAGEMSQDNVWVPNWKIIAEQAKKLNAKTVKTKSGVTINFDSNWNVKSVNEALMFKDGGETPVNYNSIPTGIIKPPKIVYTTSGSRYMPEEQTIYLNPEEDYYDPSIYQHEMFHHWQNLNDKLRKPDEYEGPLAKPSIVANEGAQMDYYNRRNVETKEEFDKLYKQFPVFRLTSPYLNYDKKVNPELYKNPKYAEGEAEEYQDYIKGGGTPAFMAKGGLIKRADGSYSKRGLWDNIRANRGSGRKPTAEMLEQERKIKKKEDGGWINMYAEGDTVTNPTTIQPKLVNIQDPKTNTITQISSSDFKYKEMYPNLMNVDEQGNLSKTLPEVEVKVRPNVSGCVAGMCYEMGENSGQSLNDFRHRNNLYGDSWNLLNNAYGTDIKLDNKDFFNLKVNDVVNLTRDAFDSDAEKGIPATNQHVGFISKIVDGVPYVKHFIGHQYYEEPINDINAVFKYQPTKVKRLADYQDLNVQPSSFKFDQGYEPNNIEEGFLKGSQQKPNLQKVLSLNTDDYDNLEKLAYGIMYNEGKFGRSKKTLYRMVVPDFLQKAVKVADDIRRGVNVYDENINNLSQGYSSTKESTLHGVSKTDKNDKRTPAEINKAIKEGDYSGLERTNNYLYYVLGEMGLNTDNLENGENSYKAVMANLSWLKKRYPGATNEALLKMYTGKKNVSSYEKSVEKAQRNIDNNPNNNLTYSAGEKFYGALSNLANKVNSGVKTTSSKTVGVLRDAAPTPITVNALLGDIAGSKEPITEKSLSNVTLDKLKEIVKNQVSQGKYTLDYNSYFPELSRDQRLGVSGGANDESGVVEKISRATSPGGMLQNFLGQANIVDLGNGEYEITDSYDFNDKGKSFGVMDDLIKRGASPYAIPRAIGRNFGSQDNQGAPVKIRVKLENGGFIQSYGQGGCCNGMYGNGSTVTTNKPPQKTLKQALLDYKENADENKWEFVDISGLTSWDDAARGYESWQKSGRTLPTLTEGMDMFSAVPLLGKAKKIEMGLKETANAVKRIPWGKIYGAVDYLRDEYNDKIKKKDDGSWVADSSLPTPTTPPFYPAGKDRTLTNYQMGTDKARMYNAGSTVWTNQNTPLWAAGTPTPTSTQNFRNTGSLNTDLYRIGDVIPIGMNYKTPAAGTYDYSKDVQPYHTMRLHAPDTTMMARHGGHIKKHINSPRVYGNPVNPSGMYKDGSTVMYGPGGGIQDIINQTLNQSRPQKDATIVAPSNLVAETIAKDIATHGSIEKAEQAKAIKKSVANQKESKIYTNKPGYGNYESYTPKEKEENKYQAADDRKEKIAEANKMQVQLEANGYTKDWKKELAVATQATGDKLRISDYPNTFDDYINPVAWFGRMASGLGQAPYEAEKTNSIMPYVTSIGEPLLAGVGEKVIGDFIKGAPIGGKKFITAFDDAGKMAFGISPELGIFPKGFRPTPEAVADANGFLRRRQFIKQLQQEGLIGKEFGIGDLNYAARNTDKTNKLTQLALDKYHTGFRNVQGNIPPGGIGKEHYTGNEFNMNKPAFGQTISEIENMKNAGVDFSNPVSIAEYQATHIPLEDYGYRATGETPRRDYGFIFRSDRPQATTEYGNYQFKGKPGTDYSSGNYQDWYKKYYEDLIYHKVNDNYGWDRPRIMEALTSDKKIPGILKWQKRSNSPTLVGPRGAKAYEIDEAFPFTNMNEVLSSPQSRAAFEEYRNNWLRNYDTGWRGQYAEGGSIKNNNSNTWLDSYN